MIRQNHIKKSNSPATVIPLASISLVKGFAGMLHDHRPSPDCIKKTRRVMELADTAINSWGEFVGGAGLKRIRRNHDEFMIKNPIIPTSYSMTSISLRVLEDLLEKRKPSNGQLIVTGKRRKMIDDLIAALLDLHLYFDRGNIKYHHLNVAYVGARSWVSIVDSACAKKLYDDGDRSKRINKEIAAMIADPVALEAWKGE